MADEAALTAWQAQLQQADDPLSKELLCVVRRYHGQVIEKSADGAVQLRCFISLSDPDLPPQFKGESELLVTFPATYPLEAARLDLSSWQHRMSSERFSSVNDAVAKRAEELCGMYAIRKLLTWLDNNICRLLQEGEAAAPSVSAASVQQQQPVAVDETATGEEADGAGDEKRSRRQCRFYARGITCKSGDSCKFSHEKVKDTKKKNKNKPKKKKTAQDAVGENHVEGHVPSEAIAVENGATSTAQRASASDATNVETGTTPTPKQKKKKPKKERKGLCKFFAKGTCRDGEKCKFSHDTKLAKQVAADGDDAEKEIMPKSKRAGIIITVIGQPVTPKQPTADTQVAVAAAADVPSPPPPSSSSDWTSEQQQSLDAALQKYPATMEKKERWTKITQDVDGKSLNDCIDRYKLVSGLVQSGAPIPLVAAPPSPKAVAVQDLSPPSPVASPTKQNKDKKKPLVDTDPAIAASSKIIPDANRVPIETEPELKGSQLRLEDLFLYQIGTLIPHKLVCHVQCSHCPLTFDATLSLDNATIQKWCPRCSTKHVVALRPVFTHAHSNVLAYIDSENCVVMDLLPSDMLASCLECGKEALLERITPGRRFEQACFSCHTKLALMTKRFAVGHVASGAGMPASSSGTSATGGATSQSKNNSKTKRVLETFVLGQPLPRNGACDHYKNSFRWFRFQCCGKAFPCDVCHDSSDCADANTGKIANKVICGFCCKEQSSATKECSCGNAMGRQVNKSKHWEGGAGCRDPTKMSVLDRQKFRGKNKTESQKSSRVGIMGKLRTMRAAEHHQG